jgi:hypothetical protein
MKEIIRTKSITTDKEQAKQGVEELKDFPNSVRVLFDKLPDSIKNKILITLKGSTATSLEERESKLEKTIACFDTKTREKFMERCLSELFYVGKFSDKFEAVGEENLGPEVGRLLNLLWQNRGRRDDAQLFNQEYYNNFFQTRLLITEKIKTIKLEIEKLNNSIATTIKQKRLTERKQKELTKLEAGRNLLINELNKCDDQHGNSVLDRAWGRDISARQKKEKDWTKAVAITCEYLDPAEFATAVAEQLDKTFFKEFFIAQNPEIKRFGKTAHEDEFKQAQKIVQLVSQTIEDWHIAHESEGSLKKPFEAKAEERQVKLIDYLVSLLESYQRGKKIKRTDDEMICTIRQMEVSLNLLGKNHV